MGMLAVLVLTVEARVLHSANKTADSNMYWGHTDYAPSSSDYTLMAPSEYELWN